MTPNDFFKKATFVEPTESAERNYVITKAVAVEKYISMNLSYSLGIENYEESKSFGQTSAALSFISKVNLFSDLGIMETVEKSKLILFAEIRNRFAHNEECSTFVTACTEQHVKQLEKLYGKDLDRKAHFDHLYEDVKIILEKVKNEIYNTKALKVLFKTYTQINNILIDNLRRHPHIFDQLAINKIFDEAITHIQKENHLDDVFLADIRMDFDKAFQ